MKVLYVTALLAAAGLAAAARGPAQAPASGGSAQRPVQDKPAAGAGQPQAGADAQPDSNSQSKANPFPEDTTTVPVLPNRLTPDLLPGAANGGEAAALAAPAEDLDPVRSPDEDDASRDSASGYSSSQSGIDNLLPADDEKQTGKRKLKAEEPAHRETAKVDIDVGKYYLENKDWRAALSRFQSALVLDPDEPEVYWGLAEANRHLGNFAEAKANYQKVVEYDPDSRHAKEARKALEDPQIEAAKAPAGQSQQ